MPHITYIEPHVCSIKVPRAETTIQADRYTRILMHTDVRHFVKVILQKHIKTKHRSHILSNNNNKLPRTGAMFLWRYGFLENNWGGVLLEVAQYALLHPALFLISRQQTIKYVDCCHYFGWFWYLHKTSL